MSWQSHLTNAIILKNKAQTLEQNINFSTLFRSNLEIGQLVSKLEMAKEAKRLYNQAKRIIALLMSRDDSDLPDMQRLEHTLNSGVLRTNDMIKIINSKLSKWHLDEEETPETVVMPKFKDDMPEIVRTPSHDEDDFDMSAAEDQDFAIDSLRSEVKHSLKALSNIIDYLEEPTLRTIKKELHKIIGY